MVPILLTWMAPLETRAAAWLPDTAAAETAAAPEVDPQRLRVDLPYAVETMERLATQAGALSPEQRRPFAPAFADLVTNCPYTRASFMLVFTLERQLAQVDASSLSPSDRRRLELLVRGVRAHAALLRSFGADELPRPVVGDYLYGDSWSAWGRDFPDGSAFTTSVDPIGDTAQVVDQVSPLVAVMPDDVHLRIDRAWQQVGAVSGQPSTSKDALAGWEEAFSGLAPALTGAWVAPMSELIAKHSNQGC